MPKKRYTRKSSESKMRRIAKSVFAKNTETKESHIGYTQRDIGAALTNPIVNAMTDLAEGTQQGQRDGNSVKVTSMKYDFFFSIPDVVGADAFNSIRCIFYIPKDVGDLLGTSTNLQWNEPVDYDRYTVLKDMFITLSKEGQRCVRRQGYLSFRRKGKSLGLKVLYKGSASNDGTSNRVLVYMVSDSGIVAHPQVSGYIRTFYKDA